MLSPLSTNRFLMPALSSSIHQAVLSSSPTPAPETADEQNAYYQTLQNGFAQRPEARQQLKRLQNAGVLQATSGDDAHSTLYYLAKRLTDPILPGVDPLQTVAETMDLLADSSRFTQRIAPLSDNYTMLMQAEYMSPNRDAQESTTLMPPLHAQEIQLEELNSCAVASELARLADCQPKEIARMAYEATSPATTVHEKVKAKELFAENPILATRILKDLNLDYNSLTPDLSPTSPEQVFQVALPVPRLAILRAMNAQEAVKTSKDNQNKASGVAILLQQMLLYNFSAKSYDAGRDQRDSLAIFSASVNESPQIRAEDKATLNRILNQSPKRPTLIQAQLEAKLASLPSLSDEARNTLQATLQQNSTGISQEEQLMLERIMEDDKSLENVAYQQIGHPLSQQGSTGKSRYAIYGFSKPFSQIKQDLLSSLASPLKEVLVNVTDVQADGSFEKGHVVRVLNARAVRSNNQSMPALTQFLVHDTAQATQPLRWVDESAFIPSIHHITVLQDDAERAWHAMKPTNSVPASDTAAGLSSREANDTRYPLHFQTPPLTPDVLLERPEAYHHRVHHYRHQQAEQVKEDLMNSGGPSQNKSESVPVLWGTALGVSPNTPPEPKSRKV